MFSEKELDFIKEEKFFFVKKEVFRKLKSLYGTLYYTLKSITETHVKAFPANTNLIPKFSKGENYQDLPYYVLDYPRLYSRESIFAFRTMFWWGNEFSFTLHLSGTALKQYKGKLIEGFDILKSEGLYVCINNSPWEYHFREDNYKMLQEISKQEFADMTENEFIKLSFPLELNHSDKVIEVFALKYKIMLGILHM